MTPFLVENIDVDLPALKREVDAIPDWIEDSGSMYKNFYKPDPNMKFKLGVYFLYGYCYNPLEYRYESMSPHPTLAWKDFPSVHQLHLQLPGETDSIRITKLPAGYAFPLHRDWLANPHRKPLVRFHIPIYTHPLCTFKVFEPDSKKVHDICYQEGTVWYLQARWTHLHENNSPIDRVHLIIEKQLDTSVQRLIDTLMPPTKVTKNDRFSSFGRKV